jgi:hypothetical protein
MRKLALVLVLSSCMLSLSLGAGWAALPACKNVSAATISSAEKSAQSQFCSDAAPFVTGAHSSHQVISTEAKTIFTNLVSQFGLPPFCAASIIAVEAQSVADGKLSAGSCTGP